jgi:tetratricopeptide (TPR) repeat protein
MNSSLYPAARQRSNPLQQVPSPIAQGFQKAVDFHQSGRLAEAEQIYRKILTVDPHHAGSLHQLGLLAYQVGRSELAVDLYRKAIAVDKRQAVYHTNLGLALQSLGELEEAAASYSRALNLNPRQAEAHLNLGLVLGALGKQKESIASIRRALIHRPQFPEAHFNLGHVLQEQGKLDEAILSYRRAIKLSPELAEAYCNLANIFSAQEKQAEAIAHYEKALAIKPNYAEAYYNLGNVYRAQDKLSESCVCYERALAINPHFVEAHCNLGTNQHLQNRPYEAVASFERALALRPEWAEAHYNLGSVLKDLGRMEEASVHLCRALEIMPDHPKARFALALTQLKAGDFLTGWPNYESRWQSPDHDTPRRIYSQPLWRGEKLESGSLFLWGEQGIGDEIQFAGLIPDAIRSGSRIVLECEPRLQPLFVRSFPGIDVIPNQKTISGMKADVCIAGADFGYEIAAQLPTGSLPALFRPTEAFFTGTVSPYLKADQAMIDQFRARYGEGRRIGIAWRTNNKNTGRKRSLDLELLAPLFAHSGLHWISLQYGDFDSLEEQVKAANAPILIDRSVDQMKNIDLFAAQVAAMDLVITIDNSTAHLAGALGIPVRLLLPFTADWRWLLERQDSPWYPSLRLFRQPKPDDWKTVVQHLESFL